MVDLGGASGAGMILAAAAAVASGQCRACLCLTGSPLLPPEDGSGKRAYASLLDASPSTEFEAPYGSIGPNLGYAQIAQRYEYEYGPTAPQRAKIAVHQRDNACANPKAFFHGRPITVDDVLNSPMIADPLHLLEIVMPAAGAAAIVVTSVAAASTASPRPAFVHGYGAYCTHRSVPFAPSLTDTAIRPAAADAFAMAGVGPKAIGLASVYDCYTITVMLSLEDAGFCDKGAGARFVDEHDFHHDGDFPLNTHGGQLSFGQPGMAGGMSHVTEAALQIQGRAGSRQVRDLEFAFVNGNGGIMSEQVSLVLGANP
jgi:acetyl-CoA acetyltransferase